jgi:hypothetical protein
MMNKKGLTARNWIIALILFTGLFTLGTLMAADLANNYGNSDILDDSINERYGLISNSTGLVSESLDAVQAGGGRPHRLRRQRRKQQIPFPGPRQRHRQLPQTERRV